MITALHIEGLGLVRGGRRLFEGLDLGIQAGEAVALTGPNGSGKTSLLRTIAGLVRPAAGRVRFACAAGDLEAEEARGRGLHLVGHQDGLKTGRNAWEELLFQARWTGGEDASARTALERFGLAAAAALEVRMLSAGQRRRLALARLIASPRPLWLLDEPLAPLDSAWRARFGEMMAEHIAGGGLILAAVHDPLPIPTRAAEIPRVSLNVLLRRELALAWGKGGGPLLACAFYAATAALLPLAAGPEPGRLGLIATGSAWVALALASLLSLERLFERDFEDGALDLLVLSPQPLELVCAVKCLAQWLAAGAPLALLAPVVTTALGAPPALAPLTLACALVGGLGFAFTGGLGAALALGSRRGGLLIAVIVLPLFVPPVVFGGGGVDALAGGLDWRPGFLLLCAYSLAAVGLSPFAMAAACRNALS